MHLQHSAGRAHDDPPDPLVDDPHCFFDKSNTAPENNSIFTTETTQITVAKQTGVNMDAGCNMDLGVLMYYLHCTHVSLMFHKCAE